MKNFISTIMASAALFTAVPAMANPITAEVTVQKGSGPILNCTFLLTFDFTPPPPDTVTIDIIPPSDLGCYTIVFNPNLETPTSMTHNYTGPGNDFTISDIWVDTTITPGDCKGSLTAIWTGSTWSVSGVLNEGVPSTGDCTVNGIAFP